jgi:glycosyltransferase involved in cell wall biosynthesis
MNVLLVTGIFPPDHGGPATYVPRLADALARRGHQVQVVCWSDSLEHDDSSHGFRVFRIPRRRGRAYRLARTVRVIAALARRSDVVLATGLQLETAIASFFTATPIVFKVVGDSAWERASARGWFAGTMEEYQRAHKTLGMRLFDAMRTLPLLRAAAVIVPSQYVGRLIESWGHAAERTSVIPNAAYPITGAPEDFRLSTFAGATIVTVGRLIPLKGIDDLLMMVAGTPDWRIVVVGDGPRRDHLERLAIEQELGDRALFTGALSPSGVEQVLRQADVFVLNSTGEGLSHVLLEAMRAGLPVVATAVGGNPEVVSDGVTGFLVPVGNRAALQLAIQRALDDGERGGAVARAGQTHVTSAFGIDAMVSATADLLDKVALRAGAGAESHGVERAVAQ